MTRTAQMSGRHAHNNHILPSTGFPWSRWILVSVCMFVLFVLNSTCFAATSQDKSSPSPFAVPARTWALDCATNEVLVIQHPNSFLRYRLHVVDGKGDQIRDQIETPQGTVSRLIQRDGRPLTAREDAAERDRLNGLAASPAKFARRIRHDEDNRELGVGMIRMMPNAMLWDYSPGQPQLPDHPAGAQALIVLDFKPDPKWSPPTLESELFTGIQGRVWVDPNTHYLVHVEASLFRTVNIGWGMLAHVYPGGTVTLQQANVAGSRWIVEHIVEQIALQALIVKSVKQKLVSETSDFQANSPMSYQQAIKVLLDTPLPAR